MTRPADILGEALAVLEDAQKWARLCDECDCPSEQRDRAIRLAYRARAKIEDATARMQIESGKR